MTQIANKVYTGPDIDFTLSDLSKRSEARKVLLCTPDYFNVVDVKNIHMQQHLGSIDKEKALAQWTQLKATYCELEQKGILQKVSVIPGANGLEDMVFTANQSFPWQAADGTRQVIMSHMKHPSRREEVIYFEEFYRKENYKIIHLPNTLGFEGMGDAIPHPGKHLLYGGYGHRTAKEVYTGISQLLKVPIIALELIDERFYHLDTCFLPVSSEEVLLCKEAFTPAGLQAIAKVFKNVTFIPEEEASTFFALNAHVIFDLTQPTAIIQTGSMVTKQTLQNRGLTVIELDTSEFIKSGGSVFCMKMMYY